MQRYLPGFPHSNPTLRTPALTICTTRLTFNNSTFCPHSVFRCFVWIWEQTAIISLYKHSWSSLLVSLGDADVLYLKMPPSDPQNQPQCHTVPPATHPNTPIPITLPSELTNKIPCYQPAFTRRTSGHWLWNFRATNPSDSLSSPHPSS
jgi:hypothetical protein